MLSMLHRNACLLMFVCLVSFAAPVAAQTTEQEGFEAAQAQLRGMSAAEADTLAFERCLLASEARSRSLARVWCALGSRRAVSRIDSWGGPRPSIEVEVVKRALWMNAVDGLQFQNNPWWGSPRSETIPLDQGLRTPAYILLAVILRQDRSLIDFRFQGLGYWVEVEFQRGETWGQFRRRIFDRLAELRATKPDETATVLWATAATGLTLQLNSEGDAPKAEAENIAAQLAGLAATAEPLSGEDGALAPALYLSEGLALLASEQYPQAEVALGRGTELCPQRIWQGARLCNVLEATYARAVAARRAHAAPAEEAAPIPQ